MSDSSAEKSLSSIRGNCGECGLFSAEKINLVVKQTNLVPGKNSLLPEK